MDACEIANFLATELFMHQLVSYDGINSGVPTRTTATLTPTTLRNIEQTFLELQNDNSMSAPYQAGFVPPAPAPMQSTPQFTNLTNVPPYSQHHIPQFMIEQDQHSMESLDTSSMSDTSWQTPPPPTVMDEIVNNNSSSNSIGMGSTKGRPRSQNTKSGNGERRTGGRKPNKPSNLSPEEEEKRRIRRERNKLAAARCRRRREDHTQELVDETEGLERKKQQMQNEITQLTQQRDELLCLLESHKHECRIPGRQSPPDIKPVIVSNGQQVHHDLPPVTTTTIASTGLKRPHPHLVFTSNNNAHQVITTTTANNNGVLYNNNNNNNNNNILDINGLPEKIKSEPEDFYDDDEPPRKKAMVSGNTYDITTPTSPIQLPIQLNTPTIKRPQSLNVQTTMRPSDILNLKNVSDFAGIPVQTPSTGIFNFDSLMDGGTGLTPVSAPLVPSCSTQNRNPMELQTPTSEPSKLVSL
jgi:fos-like antigen